MKYINRMNLKHLSDSKLLLKTKELTRQEREVTAEVLHHLKEIERRRLFSELGYGSLFDYAVKELGYSEPAANRRIQSARLLKEFPKLEQKLIEGSVSLTNLTQVQQFFVKEEITNREEKIEIIACIENATKKECEQELLKHTDNPVPKEIIKQIKTDLHTVKFNFTNETLTLLNEIKDVLSHNRFSHDELMRRVFKIALPVLKESKFKTNAKLTTPAASPSINRHIPNLVKKKVYERDGGKCTKCKSTYKLEFDHVKPYAHGGKHTTENLRLLCFSCNQRRLQAT